MGGKRCKKRDTPAFYPLCEDRMTPPPLLPSQICNIMCYMGWSLRYAANFLGYSSTSVHRWKTGKNPIPHHVAEELVKFYNLEHKLRLQDPKRGPMPVNVGGRPREYDLF